MLSGALGAVVLVGACSGKTVSAERPSAERAGEPLPPDVVEIEAAGPSYPGTGFRVHEWGTNTVVVGSDGSMQRGLHHEEEDLPAFVYDRARKEIAQDPTNVKMETPVTYFYSDVPRTAVTSVQFPSGVFTQWYPHVAGYAPPVVAGKGDPAFDRDYPFSSPECRASFARAHGGVLAWGEVSVLARDAPVALPEAPLDRTTWAHARDVAANPVRVTVADRAEDERFLFYRGLGSFPLDVKVKAQAGPAGDDGGLALSNLDSAHAAGPVFVLRVEKDRAAFAVHPSGIAPSATLTASAPKATQPLDAYVKDLARAMVGELDRAGLYHDESVAMVKTWARQWFRTPGVRVLYLAPRAWTDVQIPLSIDPQPVELVRVMVIRVEALTRVEERRDVDAARLFAAEATKKDGEAHFASLGRFAEPRLRRALALFEGPPPPAALAHLDAISGADVALRTGE